MRAIKKLFNNIKNWFICLKYPFLKISPSDVYPWIRGYEELWTWDLPIGWRKSFIPNLIKELSKFLKDNNIKGYKIEQVKEKFGGLRWYHDDPSNLVYDNVIYKYEEMSYHTCCKCGKPSTKFSKGWVLPYCDSCLKERENNNA